MPMNFLWQFLHLDPPVKLSWLTLHNKIQLWRNIITYWMWQGVLGFNPTYHWNFGEIVFLLRSTSSIGHHLQFYLINLPMSVSLRFSHPISHLKVFGCLCYASTCAHPRTKFDPRNKAISFLISFPKLVLCLEVLYFMRMCFHIIP